MEETYFYPAFLTVQQFLGVMSTLPPDEYEKPTGDERGERSRGVAKDEEAGEFTRRRRGRRAMTDMEVVRFNRPTPSQAKYGGGSNSFQQQIFNKQQRERLVMDNEFDNDVKTTATAKVGMNKKQGKHFNLEGKTGTNRALAGTPTLLTDSQELFCGFVADNYSYTQAYLRAYNCAPSTANTQGSELMKKDHIKKRVEEMKRERAATAQLVNPHESLVRWNELYKLCMSNNDVKGAMEAQKNIDKINGAHTQVDASKRAGLFLGETPDEWAALLPGLMQNVMSANAKKVEKDKNDVLDKNELN